MAVIKVFDSKGVKTVVLMGNINEQDYDPLDEGMNLADADADGEE